MTQTQQPGWTYPMPSATPPGHTAPASTSWYRRHWVQLVAVGVVCLGIGGAAGSSSAADSQKKLTAAQARATTAETAAATAEGKVTAAQGAQATAERKAATAVANAEAAVKGKFAKQAADLSSQAAALNAKASALTARENTVQGIEADAKANEIAGDGLYRVGSDIQPGVYKAGPADSGNCYHSRLASLDSSDIIDNGNTSGAVVIVVAPTDTALELSGCNTFQRVG